MPAWDRAAVLLSCAAGEEEEEEWGQHDIWCGCQVQLDDHSLEFSV